ncbi:stage III sporulation protein AG [Clostridium guangxiense]|uniref:stage III sporulation protein AG n=1 Tax=Clostridium guangxiense TaxID=1662055 RepID=UPI001E3ACF1C|nr:stage III sporulation protein AG [Clostridium guangxiense]MCD2345164.1 stage III sporulation protein AG [Clostridium guangxiense]
MDFKKLMNYFKDEKKKKNAFTNILIIGLIGILIVIVASFFNSTESFSQSENSKKEQTTSQSQSQNQNQSSSDSIESYETNVENKLKNTLEQMDGVGKVQIMMYFSSGEEQVPAFNVNKSTSVTDETDNSGGKRTTTQNSDGDTVVMSKDGDKESPLILKTYKPKITGVCIVAEGAEDENTKLNITNAVVELFGVPADKVNVYPMKK